MQINDIVQRCFEYLSDVMLHSGQLWLDENVLLTVCLRQGLYLLPIKPSKLSDENWSQQKAPGHGGFGNKEKDYFSCTCCGISFVHE